MLRPFLREECDHSYFPLPVSTHDSRLCHPNLPLFLPNVSELCKIIYSIQNYHKFICFPIAGASTILDSSMCYPKLVSITGEHGTCCAILSYPDLYLVKNGWGKYSGKPSEISRDILKTSQKLTTKTKCAKTEDKFCWSVKQKKKFSLLTISLCALRNE